MNTQSSGDDSFSDPMTIAGRRVEWEFQHAPNFM